MTELQKRQYKAIVESKVIEIKSLTGADIRKNSDIMFVYNNITGSEYSINSKRFHFLNELIRVIRGGVKIENSLMVMSAIKNYSIL